MKLCVLNDGYIKFSEACSISSANQITGFEFRLEVKLILYKQSVFLERISIVGAL